ncbi:MAG: carboxylating nicotinate-nucleotide diphosphorylase [Deltaproteobacteria bacterium]|nr:carboxylating nicotinate-nucleotide diphosphorylase [Deltaproteobacteria bacterium]
MKYKFLIQQALAEDIGAGDITSDAIADSKTKAAATIKTKQDIVLAGMDIARDVFLELDSKIKWQALHDDGDFVKKGKIIAMLEGGAAAILKGERTALNFLQHLCGIATLTKQFVDAVKGTKAKILDTRKTLPGWRELEKYAVKMGGGANHRQGLFDRYLIKNNHIDMAGGIAKAIEKVLPLRPFDRLRVSGDKGERGSGQKVLIEVEVRNFEELKAALQYPIDIVLLDNFEPEAVRGAMRLAHEKVKFEVSGGITLDNVALYAATKVDFISVGALTHSAPAADIHLCVA